MEVPNEYGWKEAAHCALANMIELNKEVDVNDVGDDDDSPPYAWEEMVPE